MSESLDPRHNHVTFHLRTAGKLHTLQGIGPARAQDCVTAIWQVLARDSGAQAREVYEIYSEWEPADEDMAFLDRTFPQEAQLGYTFKRPSDDGWEQAYAAAAKVIEASDADGRRR
ncbi:MAG: hypothetical protein OEZ06_07395 [Myxococcales bacterium]|nr:hypothetical protein [Myxococcales bacterium]